MSQTTDLPRLSIESTERSKLMLGWFLRRQIAKFERTWNYDAGYMHEMIPCTQLGIDMAERGGVDPMVLRAIVARDFAAMPDEVAVVVRFTDATLRHAPEADELREDVVRRFGKRGLIALAFTMLRARMYPTLKY